jgi:hypothetical protein
MTGAPHSPEADATRAECMKLLDLLYTEDDTKITPEEFSLRLKAIINRTAPLVKVTLIHKIDPTVQKAVEVFKAPGAR